VLSELAKSDRKVFQQLMQELDPHPLQRGAVLGSVRANTDYVYFIESGVVSLVANTNNGSSVEVALVGREGVAGLADALGGHAPRSAVSQAASTLRDKGIIDYRRGVLTIRNTARLHKVSCECFDVVSLASGLAAASSAPRVRTARKR